MPKLQHNPEITALMTQKGFTILEHEGHTTYERTRDGFTEIVCKADSTGGAELPRHLMRRVDYYRFPVDESPEYPERRCALGSLLSTIP